MVWKPRNTSPSSSTANFRRSGLALSSNSTSDLICDEGVGDTENRVQALGKVLKRTPGAWKTRTLLSTMSYLLGLSLEAPGSPRAPVSAVAWLCEPPGALPAAVPLQRLQSSPPAPLPLTSGPEAATHAAGGAQPGLGIREGLGCLGLGARLWPHPAWLQALAFCCIKECCIPR